MTYPAYSSHRDMADVCMPGALLGLVSYMGHDGQIYHRLDVSFQKIKANYTVPALASTSMHLTLNWFQQYDGYFAWDAKFQDEGELHRFTEWWFIKKKRN